jgi:hypothetical protein
MRKRWDWLLLTGSLLAGTSARAEGPVAGSAPHTTSADRDSAAYCRWVKAIAASNADPMIAPSVYASGGFTSPADATDNASTAALPPTQRLIVAGMYSLGSLNRGLAMRSQADAECKRYATTAELRAFVERNRDAESVRALRAKGKVLDDAVPHAADLLATQKALLAASRLTVEEVDGTQIRTDTLRALAAETRQRIDALAAVPQVPKHSYKDALAQRDAAEAEAEKEDGRVRASYGWDFILRGGYDRIFGVADNTPLFAMATLTLNLGWFFQGGANSDALAARRDWVRAEVEGLDDRVEQVAARLRAVRNGEVARLRETTVLLTDLEARFKSVGGISGDKARAYADYVWFDLVRVQAEHAYYAEHVRELNEMLGESGGT